MDYALIIPTVQITHRVRRTPGRRPRCRAVYVPGRPNTRRFRPSGGIVAAERGIRTARLPAGRGGHMTPGRTLFVAIIAVLAMLTVSVNGLAQAPAGSAGRMKIILDTD